MLNIFFEKGEKITFIPGHLFIKVSNNLDSHPYALQRVKDAPEDYIWMNYFPKNLAHVLLYYTCWKQTETIFEEVVRKGKEKKGTMLGLLHKKSKAEGLNSLQKQHSNKEEPIAIQEEVLYIQLQSFSEIHPFDDLLEIRKFIALIYLLAIQVQRQTASWPMMHPVMTESRKFKFIKKGKSLDQQLVNLLKSSVGNNGKLLSKWSQKLHELLLKNQSGEYNKQLSGLIKSEITEIIDCEYQMMVREGSQLSEQSVKIKEDNILVLRKGEKIVEMKLEEYQISYYHKDTTLRQIYMQHSIQNDIILQGSRDNFIIKYLKQMMIM